MVGQAPTHLRWMTLSSWENKKITMQLWMVNNEGVILYKKYKINNKGIINKKKSFYIKKECQMSGKNFPNNGA